MYSSVRTVVYLIVIGGLLYLPIWTMGQDIYKINYTIDDGLPSNQVYEIVQDKEGLMWFGTDRGLCNFNGYDFKLFNIEDGLPDKLVFNLYCDYRNRIWVGTGVPRISYIENNRIVQYKFNHVLDSAKLNRATSYSIYVDENDNLFYGDKYNGIIIIDSTGNMQQIDHPGASYLILKNTIVSGMTIGSPDFTKIRKTRMSKQLIQNIFTFKDGTVYHDTSLFTSYENSDVLNEGPIGKWVSPDLQYFIQGNCFTTKTNGGYSTRLFLNRVDAVNFVKRNELWVGMCETGIEVFDTSVSMRPKLTMHESNYITEIVKDMNSGYWFSTINEGVYYYPSVEAHFLVNSSLPRLRVVDIQLDNDGGAYVMYNNKDVWYVDAHMNTAKILKSRDRLVKNKSHIFFDHEIDKLIVGKEESHYQLIEKDKKLSFIQFSPHKRGAHITSIGKLEAGKYLFGRRGVGIASFQENGYLNLSKLVQLDGQTLKIEKFKNGWLFANDIGLFSFIDGILRREDQDPVLKNQVTDIAKIGSDDYFLAIPGRGMGVLTNDSFKLITSEDGLVDNSVFTIEPEGDSVLWVGTAKGMNRLMWKRKKKKIWNVAKYGNKDGLPSEFITQIKLRGDKIWVGTVNGLVCVNKPVLLGEHKKPYLKIDEVMVNNHSMDQLQGVELKHNQNFIKFMVTGVSYESNKNILYSYRMSSTHKDWRTTSNRMVEYNNILPGHHLFEIKAKNQHNLWSEPQQISFTIAPPFYLTSWFIFLEVLMLIGTIIGLFKWREKRAREKDKIITLERNRLEMELNALRAQMNPHFTFNVLNSIQQYIMSNNKTTAQKYLSTYAQMVRNILDYSREGFISLSKEIDFLKTYIELELMRFPKKIEYEIHVNEDLENDLILVPALLIQPYVENAINHGLLNSDKQGKLIITIEENGDILKCTIEDNGIGREAAMKIREESKRNHVSAGLSINKRRLELLNADAPNDVSVTIEDLKDSTGVPAGTKVELLISMLPTLA